MKEFCPNAVGALNADLIPDTSGDEWITDGQKRDGSTFTHIDLSRPNQEQRSSLVHESIESWNRTAYIGGLENTSTGACINRGLQGES